MIDTPQIVQSPQQRTAAIHVTIPRSEIQQAFAPAVGELLAALREQGISPTGPLLSYHLRMPSDSFDFEIALPVDARSNRAGASLPARCRPTRWRAASTAARWKASARPGASCATGWRRTATPANR